MTGLPHRSRHCRPVPTGRLSRLGSIGTLATGLAGGMLAEGARQISRGKRPSTQNMMLTPANIRRVSDQLARLRRAAMKIGQLVSMEAGELLPLELTAILMRLQSQADPMPFSQLTNVLEASWGEQWPGLFRQFSFEPFAAASIGQVHRAKLASGKTVAVKVQYPGIADSIDSDVDNVVTLLKLSGLLPGEVEIDALVEQAKTQLHAEADYLLEADWMRKYRRQLETDTQNAERFVIPEVDHELTAERILVMSFEPGKTIEQLETSDETTRHGVVAQLLELFFRELLEFRMVQTDPNFANYLFREESRQLILLDFGATRRFEPRTTESYRQLMLGALNGDREAVEESVARIGFFRDEIVVEQRLAVVDLFIQACEPLTTDGPFDFGRSQLAKRIAESGMELSIQKNYWHTPPVDALFLHRKLAGLYLLATKLKARIDVRALFLEACDRDIDRVAFKVRAEG